MCSPAVELFLITRSTSPGFAPIALTHGADLRQFVRMDSVPREEILLLLVCQDLMFWNELVFEQVEGGERFWKKLYSFLLGSQFNSVSVSSVGDDYCCFYFGILHGFRHPVDAVYPYCRLTGYTPNQSFFFLLRHVDNIAYRIFMFLFLNQLVTSEFYEGFSLPFFKSQFLFAQALDALQNRLNPKQRISP